VGWGIGLNPPLQLLDPQQKIMFPCLLFGEDYKNKIITLVRISSQSIKYRYI
jgi:hypothetical protein